MTNTPSKTTAGARRRKDDLVKPDHLTFDQWLFKIENERAEINRQVRREVHTRGFVHAKYCERLDRAIILARAGLREPERDLDADADAFLSDLVDDEISVIDRMIDDNSRDAASARSEAERRGYKETIERLEAERDRLIEMEPRS